MHFEFEVENLDYGYIESGISRRLDLGGIDTSNFPMCFSDWDSGNYFLCGTKGSANVSIAVYKNNSGNYTISCNGEKTKKRR